MSVNIQQILSSNALHMRRSAIRDLLSVITSPNVISFGGGFPNASTFPVEELKRLMMEVMDESADKALQYSTTEGHVGLRQELAKMIKRTQGVDVDIKNILITTASQQALDLVSRIFINPGDTVVCELPSYLGALQTIWAQQGNPVGFKSYDEMDKVITDLTAQGKKPKYIYLVPDFRNPSGTTMTLEERKLVLEVARKHDMLIIEDSPYRDIRFEGEPVPTILSLDKDNRVVQLGTFSKTFVPGFRIGWVVGPDEVINRLIVGKQCSDLCTPVMQQMIAAKYLASGHFDEGLKKISALYKTKKQRMISALEREMPKGVSWTNPEGGLFLLITLPEGLSSIELFDLAVKEDVAYVPGTSFFCDGKGENTLRLNFSYASDEKIDEGIARLARAIRAMYKIKGINE